ncbi:MAG: MnhB domain-containing protein [Candidatus Saelkia tenebricola]|nr:MnhB domain-containing protein [Candidatus Saelkia tenebricola]
MNSENNNGMSLIIKTVTRLTVGFIFIYGIYIVLHGHVSPGGGFAGGVIIALSFVNLMLAYGKEELYKRVPKTVLSLFESIGAIMFLSIALLGFTGGYFFYDWFVYKGEPFSIFSAGTMPLSNIAIAIKVASGLFAIFLVLILLRVTSGEEE